MNLIFGSDDVHKGKKLQVRIGPSVETLAVAQVNDDSNPHYIDSPYFVGFITPRIKGFPNQSDTASEKYFDNKKRLFALQISGRFKQEYTADDIVFGSQFERKCTPPYGVSVAMKVATLIDPALTTDVFADSPWIFSPIVCSMNVINVQKTSKPITNAAKTKKIAISYKPDKAEKYSNDENSEFIINGPDPDSKEPIRTVSAPLKSLDANQCHSMLDPWSWVGGKVELEEDNTLMQGPVLEYSAQSWSERRKYFCKLENRRKTVFSPSMIYNMEIYAPFINLNTFDLSLGININILQYLNGQPLRMMAKSLTLGKYLFVVEFALVESDSPKPSKTSKK